MSIRLDGQVAIVTGAGQGLGRCHALALAERGAKVVVNDLGDESGRSENADAVVAEIKEAGGEAMSHGANVSNAEQVNDMVAKTMAKWGRVDILINNAGILRDKTFLKMPIEDFRLVIEVHLMGTANCTKAVWEIMREQNYGRIVFTTSSSGLYGNFGQANYSAAKMAMVGLMNTLHLEGAKNNIHVNCLAPTAGTAMTAGLFPEPIYKLLSPESVSPGVVFLASEGAPSRKVLGAGGGSFAVFKGFETDGVNLLPDKLTPEGVAAAWSALDDESGMKELTTGFEQSSKFATKAARSLGIDLSE
ncbi:MAG: SDR family NAD(P)-dependent oxidoreductase [Gammaproteobacteria bacterium]|nr:SDR family NAD(P)-dependent oxidoreductase [Gammaproteobacteria bacterium]MDH3372656.1 SDR family NAD(P)-dependent oxidoreductase [Gammaproteobacteria bacterium]MDH3409503.1 SDR family NAD(P)-dependent oxidoreductase [Gammaproteobacteria bacterium]MDH3551009.1 SDR family NAD(P)-dependent oxidoreductase [Gammaproteobacteria bacterium]